MTKRESGWYRVKVSDSDPWELAEYCSETDQWNVTCSPDYWVDIEFCEINPRMVMTPFGKIVYNQPAHDPLYNTKQEG